MGLSDNPEDFTGKSTEEIQEHFLSQRKTRKENLANQSPRRKNVDVDDEFAKIMLVVHREITKLVDMSREDAPLEVKNHDAVIAYAKLISGLKKDIANQFREMNPEEMEKIADDGS